LPPFLRPDWDWARDHYRAVGLEVADEIVWDTRIDILREFPGWHWSVFFWGEIVDRLAPAPRRCRMVAILNNKNRFFSFAEQQGASLPRSLSVAPGELTSAICEEFGFPLFLKPAGSAQGMGIQCCNSVEELAEFLEPEPFPRDLQIQEVLPEETVFQNVMYDCSDGRANRLMVTDQILHGFSHGGNASPVGPVTPWEVTDELANAAASGGMAGPLGFDVAVKPESGGDSSYSVIDCNPRFNGASYPIGVAQRLGLSRWRLRSYPVRSSSLEDLGLEALAYNPHEKTGVVAVNWAAREEGKLGVLCTAPDWEQVREVEEELESICTSDHEA
jgi:hypothetical protein